MAKGDLVFFNSFLDDVDNKQHDWGADTYKFALVTNATVPAATTAVPHWGGTGTTDFSANEVSGTNYTAGGETLTQNVSRATNVLTWDFTSNPSWTKHASGPTNIRWGMIYNNTLASKLCVAYIDMGGGADISLVDGNISFTFHASGMCTLTRS